MKKENISILIDLCQEAGRLQSFLPALPAGLSPRDIRVAERVAVLTEKQGKVRVSDISEMLEVTRPGITMALSNLEAHGYVEKSKSNEDGRTVLVRLTEAGEELVRRWVTEMHADMAENEFAAFSDEEVLQAARLVHRAVQLTREFTARHS